MRDSKQAQYDKFVYKALWIFDKFYNLVCGKLECTYCTFYRGVAVGVVLGSVISYAVVAN